MSRVQGSLEQLIRKRVADHPQATWLKWRDTEISWNETLSNVQRVANGLLDVGVRPGDRVALLLPNRPEFLWTHLATMFLGAQSVPVNVSQRGPALHHILADSDATTAVVHDSLRKPMAAVRDECPGMRRTVVLDGPAGNGMDVTFDRLLEGTDREPEVEVTEPATGAGMMYTSGTTGPPKGVVSTGARPGPLRHLLAATGVRPGETMYTALPLFHGNALMISAIGSMILDAKLALAERFSASRLWSDCKRYDAVEFNALGGMISILLKQPPRPEDRDHKVRVVLSAAAPADRWSVFEDRFRVRIVEFYGMVDSPGCLLNTEGKVGSMGRPVGDIQFAVVDDDDNQLTPGRVGELIFRDPGGPTTHYHKLPSETDHANRGGWFHSGDLAEVDEDGWWYYRGRKKESMRRLGENISAWEVESVVLQHPDVLECGAHAVRSDLGEDEVKIAVVSRPGAGSDPRSIVDFCAGKLARYAIPRYVEFVDSLPKTDTHRVQYSELRKHGITAQTWDREAEPVADSA